MKQGEFEQMLLEAPHLPVRGHVTITNDVWVRKYGGGTVRIEALVTASMALAACSVACTLLHGPLAVLVNALCATGCMVIHVYVRGLR